MQTENSPTLWRAQIRGCAIVFCIWTLLAVLSAVETYVMQSVHGPAVPWSLAFRRSFEEWYSWAVLSLGVIWMGNRFPFQSGRALRWTLIHTTGSAVFSVACAVAVSWLLTGQRSVQDGNILTFHRAFSKIILNYCLFNATMYWLVLLGHHGWMYYQRYRERERQASALTTELMQARLNLLRLQLNPHFLFNTLNTISALIHEDPNTADKVLVRLGQLLRRTLDMAETQEVSLREELDFLDGYLDIERARFEERLTVENDIEPGVTQFLVPALILQPLVENAIRHGIEPREEMGRVRICVRRAGRDQLELKVSDNGPGFPNGETAPLREGVGLSNTRSRLSHLYGAEHTFEMRRTPEGGLEVRLLIPCRTEPVTPAPHTIVPTTGEATTAV